MIVLMSHSNLVFQQSKLIFKQHVQFDLRGSSHGRYYLLILDFQTM